MIRSCPTVADLRAALLTLLLLPLMAPAARADEPPSTPSRESVIVLVTGEIMRGVVIESSEGEVVIAHAILGRIVLPRQAIASVTEQAPESAAIAQGAPPGPADGAAEEEPPSSPPSAAPATAAPASGPPPVKPAADPKKPDWAAGRVDLLEVDESMPRPGTVEWLANLQASLSGVNSDTNQLDLRVAGALSRLSHTDKWSNSFEYFLSLLDGDTTDNNLLATSVYDYFFLPTDWLAFGKAQYQYDAFQQWENRLSAYGGLGYRLFHTRPFALTIKGGFGATHEFGSVNRTTPEAYGEAAFAWWIDERQTIEGSVNIAPDITDLGQYRVLARLDWTLRLNDRGVALVGGVREEYQSQVGSGSTRNDFRYYAGIRYDF